MAKGGMNRDQLKRPKALEALEAENQRLRRAVSDLTLDKMIPTEASRGNFEPFAPQAMRQPCAAGACRVSERRACRTLGQHRSTQRTVPSGAPDEERLTEVIIKLARSHGRSPHRCGSCRTTVGSRGPAMTATCAPAGCAGGHRLCQRVIPKALRPGIHRGEAQELDRSRRSEDALH